MLVLDIKEGWVRYTTSNDIQNFDKEQYHDCTFDEFKQMFVRPKKNES